MDQSEYDRNLEKVASQANHLTQLSRFIKGFCSYTWNTSYHEIVLSVFPDAHEDYINEKVQGIKARGIAHFVGYLDQDNFAKFTQNVAKYMAEHSDSF